MNLCQRKSLYPCSWSFTSFFPPHIFPNILPTLSAMVPNCMPRPCRTSYYQPINLVSWVKCSNLEWLGDELWNYINWSGKSSPVPSPPLAVSFSPFSFSVSLCLSLSWESFPYMAPAPGAKQSIISESVSERSVSCLLYTIAGTRRKVIIQILKREMLN